MNTSLSAKIGVVITVILGVGIWYVYRRRRWLASLSKRLCPMPRRIQLTLARFAPPDRAVFAPNVPEEWGHPALETLKNAFPDLVPVAESGSTENICQINLAADPNLPADGYRLVIEPGEIVLTASNRAGLFYGTATLAALVATANESRPKLMESCVVEDYPDLPERGFMLDVSRDKVPTLTTLFGLVDRLAALRYNQLQLYFEHVFAYRNHETVWRDASPFTTEEIRKLDDYCRSKCIELVPNQNSLGHLERWLKHPEYLPLAELPQGGAPLPWGGTRDYPSAISPTKPETLRFLSELYDELLPSFTSCRFNVGCDEVFDLRGEGHSAAQVKKFGEGRVIVDFINRLDAEVKSRGRTMMFWADMVLHHPELVKELPHDAVALVWGYEADHPFETQCEAMEKAGIPFYVCPGTSSWRSIAGRTANMRNNIRSALQAAARHGARGMLLCDWGDAGHWQPLCVSYAAIAEAARIAWCPKTNEKIPLPNAMQAAGVFPDLAEPLLELGEFYRHCGSLRGNASELFQVLAGLPTAAPLPQKKLTALNRQLDKIERRLPTAHTEDSEEHRIQIRETKLVAALLRQAIRRALNPSCEFPLELREEFQKVWLIRNRPGGLADSVMRFK